MIEEEDYVGQVILEEMNEELAVALREEEIEVGEGELV